MCFLVSLKYRLNFMVFMLSHDGYILTNNHVIDNGRNIKVVLPHDVITYEAEIIGVDPLSDLAVIKIDVQNFPFAEFGDTSNMRIGDWVIALGNALGTYLGHEGGPSVTMGIVSNLDRSFTIDDSSLYDIIQTDAAINPGNSGGPLVDLEGRVIGINTFIISAAQNIGFAVNASTAKRVYEDLVEYGHVNRPYMGISLETLTPAIATELGLSQNRGVLAYYVDPNGPSAKEGIMTNDVITNFQDHEVIEASQLIKLMWLYEIGDEVKIGYWRNNDYQEVWITLDKRQ